MVGVIAAILILSLFYPRLSLIFFMGFPVVFSLFNLVFERTEREWPRKEGRFTSDVDTEALEQVLIGNADQEIVQLEARIRAAQLGADVAALDALISDELLFTGPQGQLGTKAQDLDGYRSGTVKFLAHVPQELRIRRVGANVALAALRAQLTVEVAGNLARGLYRYTRVWAREDNKTWRVVGGHVSLVSPLDGEG